MGVLDFDQGCSQQVVSGVCFVVLQIQRLEETIKEEREEAMDVRDFLSRELQEKEEECILLKEEFEVPHDFSD